MVNPQVNIPEKKIIQFCQRYQIKRMALFGSVLRNDFRSDSDIDVLVLFNKPSQISFITLGRMQRELSGLFQRQVDLIPQEGLKPAIREEILASAQELYAA